MAFKNRSIVLVNIIMKNILFLIFVLAIGYPLSGCSTSQKTSSSASSSPTMPDAGGRVEIASTKGREYAEGEAGNICSRRQQKAVFAEVVQQSNGASKYVYNCETQPATSAAETAGSAPGIKVSYLPGDEIDSGSYATTEGRGHADRVMREECARSGRIAVFSRVEERADGAHLYHYDCKTPS